jgi:hypothetical protein
MQKMTVDVLVDDDVFLLCGLGVYFVLSIAG